MESPGRSAWRSEWTRGLVAIAGAARVLTDRASLINYENDALGFHRFRPDCVVIPDGSEELAALVRYARDAALPYTVRGSGTGLSGGSVAAEGGLILHLSRLKRILEVNVADQYCVVEPGVVLHRLNEHLEAHGLFYPPDPSSGYASTLGGNVAENAGGIRCFKYGVTANYVLGVEALLLDGRLLRFGGPAGGLGRAAADWRALMVGSEGMLATFTRLWLRLKPLPEKVWTFLATFARLEDAADMIVQLVHHPAFPVAIEFVDNKVVKLVEASPMAAGLDPDSWLLVVELDGPEPLVDLQARELEELLRRGKTRKVERTSDKEERLKLWKARKVAAGLMGQVSPDFFIQDAVIPRSCLGEVLRFIYEEAEKEGIHALNVFHAGDGNLHPNFLFDARNHDETEKIHRLGHRLMEKVVACGGTLSGEHGIGNDKMEYIGLIFGPREIALQRSLLDLFNPNHQLNPGKVFPLRSYVGCCVPEKP